MVGAQCMEVNGGAEFLEVPRVKRTFRQLLGGKRPAKNKYLHKTGPAILAVSRAFPTLFRYCLIV